MSNKSIATIFTMGIDIGKNSFHVVGLDRRGAIVLRQKWSRGQIEARLAAMPHHPRQDIQARQSLSAVLFVQAAWVVLIRPQSWVHYGSSRGSKPPRSGCTTTCR